MVHTVDKDVHVGAKIPVGYHRDVELVRIRQGADPDRDVGGDGDQREELADRSAREEEGHGRSGTSATYAFMTR